MKKKLKCILLVDDDTITNFINKRLLKKLDVAQKIEIATNGEEALSYVKGQCEPEGEQCPDVILLDINMPIMNGLEFLKEYSDMEFENKDNVKIYILTTSSYPSDVAKANNFKIDGFLNKPLTEVKLNEVIGKA